MKIHSKENLYGEYIAPSDKTVTARAIMLGSIAKGKTYIVNPLLGADAFTMINCVKKLGARVKVKDRLLEIRSPKKLKDNQRFDCDNSGTALRLLCGVVAGSRLKAILRGDKTLNQRPMTNIKEPLEMMGATVALKNYTVPPVLVKGENVKEIETPIPVRSSQVKSAILLCALQSGKRVCVKELLKTRNHTEIMLKEMGANIVTDKENKTVTLEKSEIKGKQIFVCGDFSIASNFIALGLLCGETTVKNVGVNPTRTALLHILKRMGAKIEIKNKRILCGEPIADITAYKSKLTATHVTGEEVLKIVDELPVLAVLMGMAEGESIISGLEDLQYKDGDRLAMIKVMISAIGGKCRKFKGGLVLNGVDRYIGGNVTTYGDGRIAMSAFVALSASLNGGETDDDDCLEEEFPGFVETFTKNSFVRVSVSAPKDGSNKIHSFILEKLNLKNYTYSYLNVVENTNRKVFYEVKDFKGYTVNAPYSSEAIKRIGKLGKIAKQIRSVNVVKDNSGISTDGSGLVYALKNKGVDIVGKKVLVFGLGAVGKSIALSLCEEKALVTVCNRTQKTAIDFRKRNQFINSVENLEKDMKFDIVINATPLGSGYYSGEMAIDEDIVKNCSTVVDMVVSEEDTPLCVFAKDRKKTVVCGRDPQFFTAYLSCCFLVGKTPSYDESVSFYEEYFKRSVK